jgi:hypothetical protein
MYRSIVFAIFTAVLFTAVPKAYSKLSCQDVFNSSTSLQAVGLLRSIPLADEQKRDAEFPYPEFDANSWPGVKINDMAEALVSRLERAGPKRGRGVLPMRSHVREILIFLPSSTLDSVLDSPLGIQNIHQTGTSKGNPRSHYRRLGENSARLHLDLPEPKQFPDSAERNNRLRYKSGVLVTDLAVRRPRSQTAYGDIVAVISPEVLKRSTWTIDDSSGVEDSFPFSFGVGRKVSADDFYEIQIFGDITLPRSNERGSPRSAESSPSIIGWRIEESVAERQPDLVEKLKQTGLPVFTFDRNEPTFARAKQRL